MSPPKNKLVSVPYIRAQHVLPSIIENEEQSLLEKFSVDYREYIQSAGRFLPG